jgi:hypothetical protein
MNEGDNFILARQYHLKAIAFLMIGIIIVTGISVGSLIFDQNQPPSQGIDDDNKNNRE